MRNGFSYFFLFLIVPYGKLIDASQTVEEMGVWVAGAILLLLLLKLIVNYFDHKKNRTGEAFFIKRKPKMYVDIFRWTLLIAFVAWMVYGMFNLGMETPGGTDRKIINYFGYEFSREPVRENIYYYLNFLFLLAVIFYDYKWFGCLRFKRKNNKLKINENGMPGYTLSPPVGDKIEVAGDKIIVSGAEVGSEKEEYGRLRWAPGQKEKFLSWVKGL